MSSIASGAELVTNAPPSRPGSRPAGFRTLLWRLVPIVAFCLFVAIQPGLPRGDAAGVYVTAASLVERGSFAIDGYLAAVAPFAPTADAPTSAYARIAYAAGHYYQIAPPGRALLAVPAYALGASLAPLFGPEGPAYCLLLFAALLGALVVERCCRSLAPGGVAGRWQWLGAVATIAVFSPWIGGLTVPLVLAALLVLATPAAFALWHGAEGRWSALVAGLMLGAVILVDPVLGVIAGVALLVLIVRAGLRRRFAALILLLLGGAIGPAILAGWQVVAFGQPWRLAFRAAIDAAGRSPVALLGFDTAGALLVGLTLIGLVALSGGPGGPGRRRLVAIGLAVVIAAALIVGWSGFFLRGRSPALPLDWLHPAALFVIAGVVIVLAAFALLGPRLIRTPRPGLAPTSLLIALLLLPLSPAPSARAVTLVVAPENYLAPFAIQTERETRALWKFERGQGQAAPESLRLEAGATAVSPWIDVWPGSAYILTVSTSRAVQATFGWETSARTPIVAQGAMIAPNGRGVTFAAPPGAAGLRLRLTATDGSANVTTPTLILTAGVRVEPFPNRKRAALAFSFDWESAMGGLIHSRSSGEGAGATVTLRDDGGPSVADAEEKGRRMRDGAQFLAALFAQYGIKATFYATGYNLLDGNPLCRTFLGNPTYPNANMANGWGSDWWRTHPWFGDDPCTTEAEDPAWYFASQTRSLAAAGHEIASHSFAHLYVRGVKPEQLAADLEEWNRAATALGLPPARSFAFPWTSSNSLDDRFWSVFAGAGMTILTRLYQTQAQPLPRPYELDRVAGRPDLLVFPDFYLASHEEAQREALARIDTTLATRGYHSLWNHPNEALEQDGPAIWARVVGYAVSQRDRGLWIAPVTEIATYGLATRQVAVTALPVAGGTHLTIENRSGHDLHGLTIHTPSNGAPVLATFGPGATTTVVAP